MTTHALIIGKPERERIADAIWTRDNTIRSAIGLVAATPRRLSAIIARSFRWRGRTMFKLGSICLVAGVLYGADGASAADWLKNQVVPNFARTANTGCVLDHAVGVYDLLPPPTGGPGPVTFDTAHPYVPNGFGAPPTYRVADLTNPILQPWTIPSMKRANDEVLGCRKRGCQPCAVTRGDLFRPRGNSDPAQGHRPPVGPRSAFRMQAAANDERGVANDP
jgi:hypothetical protein